MLTARVRLCGELTRQFKLQKYSNHVRDLYFGRNRSACVLLLKRNRCEGVADKNNMATLETLNFDNLVLRSLPIDSIKENFVRQVPSACFSLVDPTAVKDPEVVAHSESAMCLLDLTQEQVQRTEFAEYFSGNTKLPGSQTAAHCYCGHQFGSFAGQLGDGAAIYLGEVLNRDGDRWEIQLKGAGKTPYSRSADGRKVLRSSIREFLCSEAMHHLGIPTTRAGCCITSDTKVVRDIFYDGNPIYEKSSIVLRIAPTFIRFGSFEIVKQLDPMTGRRGPSAGRKDILVQLLDYVIKTFHPQIYAAHSGNLSEDCCLAFYKEVALKTARLVAEWQCVGFCHGVLNTDNMSIFGLTIDYGPFGFMDHFNPDFVCNASDDMARYSYKAQPEICKWNLIKLAEAMADVLPLAKSRALLEDVYDVEFMDYYLSKMRKKLGITRKAIASDRKLVEELLQTMGETGADFTNVFRCLSRIKAQGLGDCEKNNEEVLEYILSQCLDPSDFPKEPPGGQLQLLLLMMNSNPALAAQFEGSPWIQAEKEKMEKAKKLQEVTPEEKRLKDKELWDAWIGKYRKRIEADFEEQVEEIHLLDNARVDVMNKNNPRFILRNYIAENAIKAAEKGDYSVVQHVLSVLESPYSDGIEPSFGPQEKSRLEQQPTSTQVKSEQESEHAEFVFDHKAPRWAHQLRVT